MASKIAKTPPEPSLTGKAVIIATGYGYARVFTSLNPVIGGTFAASLLVSTKVLTYVNQHYVPRSVTTNSFYHEATKIAKLAASCFAAIKLAPAISTGLTFLAKIPCATFAGQAFVAISTVMVTILLASNLYNFGQNQYNKFAST